MTLTTPELWWALGMAVAIGCVGGGLLWARREVQREARGAGRDERPGP